ncbi:MAG TPA: helix-turn-helix domain-containing protein [Candidatus Paceibacterota bacterium]
MFREQLKEFFLSSEELTNYLEQADEKVVEKRELLGTLETDRATVQAEMEKVYKLYVSDQISADGFGRTYKPLEERLKALDDQLPRLQAELDFLRIKNLSRDEIVSEAQDLYGRWSDLLPEEKRQIIENVVDRITIDLSYVPSPSEIATKRQRDHTPALPFCTATMRTERKPEGYPSVLNNLADHLKKRILDLGTNQKEAARQIGVGTGSFTHWMRKHRNPTIRRWPKVIQFLGYDPRQASEGIGQGLVRWRQGRGMSQKELAAQLDVDPTTLAKWERGERCPSGDRQMQCTMLLCNLGFPRLHL